MSDTFSKVEVITGIARRRRFSTDLKLAVVAETMQPGMSISYVARRHGLSPSLVFRSFSPPTSRARFWTAANPAVLPRRGSSTTPACRLPGPSSATSSASPDRKTKAMRPLASEGPHQFRYSTTSLAKRDEAPVLPTTAVGKQSPQRACRSAASQSPANGGDFESRAPRQKFLYYQLLRWRRKIDKIPC
jgi:hypothetical protein